MYRVARWGAQRFDPCLEPKRCWRGYEQEGSWSCHNDREPGYPVSFGGPTPCLVASYDWFGGPTPCLVASYDSFGGPTPCLVALYDKNLSESNLDSLGRVFVWSRRLNCYKEKCKFNFYVSFYLGISYEVWRLLNFLFKLLNTVWNMWCYL